MPCLINKQTQYNYMGNCCCQSTDDVVPPSSSTQKETGEHEQTQTQKDISISSVPPPFTSDGVEKVQPSLVVILNGAEAACNVVGSHTDKAPCGGGWIGWYRKQVGDGSTQSYTCAFGHCQRSDVLGGHVYLKSTGTRAIYILPICHYHNGTGFHDYGYAGTPHSVASVKKAAKKHEASSRYLASDGNTHWELCKQGVKAVLKTVGASANEFLTTK